jgi:transposase
MGRVKKSVGACHIAEVKRVYKDTTYTTTLLRRTYREDGKVKHETLGNLTHLPPRALELVKRALAGEQFVPVADASGVAASEQLRIERSLPHGHVAAVLGTLNKLGLHRLLGSASPERDRVCAMIVARVLEARSKLATTRMFNAHTASTSLGQVLQLGELDEDHLYAAMDWLLERQHAVENALAKRHLRGSTLTLYDVSSTYFEGRGCPLAKLGYSRDGKSDRPQIVFGLICDERGCPIAVEVFDGNTSDPKTVLAQVNKLRERFGLERIVMVGDRGMLTSARIENDLTPEGIDWISALRSTQIRNLVQEGALQLSLFDERDLVEIRNFETDEDSEFAGERLVACRNPLLCEERRRKRSEMLQAAEKKLVEIRDAVQRERRPLRGKEQIALRVGKALARTKMAKHFRLEIGDDSFEFSRDQAGIDREAALDGIYVIRTSVPARTLDAERVVGSYKQLAHVERAFRSLKTVDLKIRPIFHYNADRVRAHVFLCMLAYYVEWHMREVLAPLLFDEDDYEAAARERTSIVAPAVPSPSAASKASTKRTLDGAPVHSFRTLLLDLGTITKNTVAAGAGDDARTFALITSPTSTQQRALSLLGVGLNL